MEMGDFFKTPMLHSLYEARSKAFNAHINKNSKENKEMLDKISAKLNSFLKYVPEDERHSFSGVTDEILFEMEEYADFLCELFYKCGVIDAKRYNDEIQKEIEKMSFDSV